jgi:hypothetical protein
METSIFKKVVARIYPFRRAAFYMQRLIVGAKNRRAVAKLFSKRLPEFPNAFRGRHLEELNALDENGYVMLPGLVRQEEVSEVLDYLKGKPVYDRWSRSSGLFSPDHPPKDCHTAPYRTEDIVNCPHLLNWANNPRILSIVGQHLGGKPTLSSLTVWWSYPGHHEPQEAENFHRDVDDLSFIKLFVYLNDVDDEGGPHVFVPGSHRSENFRKIRRYTDEEVESFFGSAKVKFFKGKAGTAFLENTFGLHKGELPKSKRRILFQAQYSMRPIGIYEYSPIPINENHRLTKLDRYINRLYIK